MSGTLVLEWQHDVGLPLHSFQAKVWKEKPLAVPLTLLDILPQEGRKIKMPFQFLAVENY